MTERALITGITGMVGSHLLDYLLRHTDWEIHGMLRWRSPLDNISGHLDDINAGGRIKLQYADLRDTMAIQNCVQAADPNYVFHLAAQSTRKPPSPRRSTHSIRTSRGLSGSSAP
jgi:GDP-D-mannose dehydratase